LPEDPPANSRWPANSGYEIPSGLSIASVHHTAPVNPDSRRPLDSPAIDAMLCLSALWGFQQVAIKLAASGISL
jgi:hypothetical protein